MRRRQQLRADPRPVVGQQAASGRSGGATGSDDKSPVYGYMRVADGRPDHEVRYEEEQLARWAEAEGYCLKAVYRETDQGGIAELTALVEELGRTGSRLVVVPS